MRTLYLECRSGISGDMTVGALLDLGADQKQLEKELNSLKIEGYALKFGRTKKAGIDAFDFDVLLEHPEHPDQHHEHAHAHSHHGAGHEHHHSDGKHGHSHEHEHHHHGHVHRNLGDVLEIIESGEMSEAAKETAKQIFHIIAESEAKAHGLPVEEVHFHEVGAVDSIIDICGAAICLEQLKVDRVIASPLSEGQGSVRCAHGLMPVPVPAVVNIAAARQVPMELTEVEGELVTPTGIAILSAVCDEFTVPKRMNIKKIGYGAGNKDLPDRANVLRAYLLEESDRQDSDEVVLLET
ncbi:MAG: LarC family nickel insertion protein, partial [Massilimaliae sp.]|nr:LarC family nickel insertion protein [Massiliimalia sp.]